MGFVFFVLYRVLEQEGEEDIYVFWFRSKMLGEWRKDFWRNNRPIQRFWPWVETVAKQPRTQSAGLLLLQTIGLFGN